MVPLGRRVVTACLCTCMVVLGAISLDMFAVLLGGAMIIEAAVLFAGFKFLGGGAPKEAAGAELVSEESPSPSSHGGGDSKESHGGGESAAPGGEHGSGGTSGSAPTKIDKRKAVEVQVVDFRAPKDVVGTNTVSSIRSGLYYGTIGMIDGILERIIEKMGPETKAIATGGRPRTVGTALTWQF